MIRVGIGYDSHRLAEGKRLILGGIEVPHTKGLVGHSDGDALLHAIGDAILGSVGAEDIGVHFPDNDPSYRNISSLILLGEIRQIAEQKGYVIQNVDATIILEKPKLKEHIKSMIDNISSVLALPAEYISVKAKTNEGMGFIGLEEGMAVMAVATVRRQVAP
ncbi:MAG: 2-C-methyl-D-erythritol 2,4-cyclodiphosphate synthase [Syntrophales bacterium]|nr:2-C-methyl-D-erythritol 2,4-cyclodiphosphate synthase [Syntrophales bacterium]